MDPGERMRLYRQADRILVQDSPIMPLMYWQSHVLVKSWVRGFTVFANGEWDAKDVIIERH